MAHVILLIYLLSSVFVLKAEDEENKTCLAIIASPKSDTPIATSATRFTDLLQNGNAFIDNSLIIKEVIQDQNLVNILEAPNGWGKKMNLGLLKMFFELEIDGLGEKLLQNEKRNPRLFESGEFALDNGLLVKLKEPLLINRHREIYSTNLGLYPVVYINFTGFRPNYYDEFVSGIHERIHDVFEPYNRTINKFLDEMEHLDVEKTKVEPIRHMFKGMEHMERSIMCLCYILEKHYHQKPVILWENYDEPLKHILIDHQHTQANVVVNFFVDLFDYTLSTNTHLHKAVITGTSKILVDCAQTISLDHEFHGFSKRELDSLFDHFKIDLATREQAIKRYGNYRIDENGATKLIADASCIAKFLESRKVESYWVPDASVTRVLGLVLSHPPMEHIFRILIAGHSYYMFPRPDPLLFPHTRPFHLLMNLINSMTTVEKGPSCVSLSYSDEKIAEDTAMRLFYSSGFLTQGSSWREDKIEVLIPNEEVRKVINKAFLQYYRWRLGVPNQLRPAVQVLSSQFIKFLFNVDETSPEVATAFETFVQGLPCFPFQFETHRNRPNKDTARYLLEFLSFHMGCFTLVSTDNETSSIIEDTNVIVTYTALVFRDHGIIIVLTMGDKTPQYAMEQTKNHLHLFTTQTQLIRDIQTVKKVGINYVSNQTVQIVGETIEFKQQSFDMSTNRLSP